MLFPKLIVLITKTWVAQYLWGLSDGGWATFFFLFHADYAFSHTLICLANLKNLAAGNLQHVGRFASNGKKERKKEKVCAYFLESQGGAGVIQILIRMMDDGLLAISLLYIERCGILRDTEEVVVRGVENHGQ